MPATVIESRTSTNVKLLPLYKVLLHNDDVNTTDHVVGALLEVFAFEVEEAVNIMLEAHKTGVALCKVEQKENAEFHQEQLQALSLTATIEPES
jgi:ATP-dependent Clp protease adaptor protein ClpS